ncbi:MAG: phage holin family protein [Ornithinibacter sp.]
MADVTHDLQGIVRGEIALAKAEVTTGAKVLGKGAGLLAGAAFFGILFVIFLLTTIAQVLDIWLPLWAAYAIVTAVILIVTAVLALLGRNALQSAEPVPERAIDQGQRTIAVLKGESEPAGPTSSS